jgi:glycerol-3-phosphate acyltransferase PlsY
MFVMLCAITMLVVAYLTGSICSAVIVSKLFQLPDPREEGSGNPGATNVLRLAGTKYALIVLLTDLLKGTLPVVVAKLLGVHGFMLSLTCLMAVLGHIYPVFFKFQGGKGVATALGVLLGLNPALGFYVLITWLCIALITHYSSLSSLIAVGLAPLYAWFTGQAISPLIVMSIIIFYQHQENIKRLLQGKESKINLKSKTKA